MTEQLANLAQTTLSAGINNSVTSIPVASTALPFPQTGNYRIVIDSEIMLVTAVADATHFTVTRGAEGTTADAHSSGAAVVAVLTSAGLAQYITERPELMPAGGAAFAVHFKTGTADYADGWSGGTNRVGQMFGAGALVPGYMDGLHDWARYAGFKSMNFPHTAAFTTGQAPTSGQLNFFKIPWPQTDDITNVHFHVVTAGASLTAGQSIISLYTVNGATATKLASTADLSTTWNSTGGKIVALAGGPFTDVAGGAGKFLYAAVLAVGTTPPALMRSGPSGLSSSVTVNGGTTAAASNLVAGSGSTGQTATPATQALTALTATAFHPWIGLS